MFSTEKIVSAVGLSKIIGGLFIMAPVAALPEVFATWYVARSGQATSGVTSVIGDHAVTMTLAFIPLTIVGMPIENLHLFWVTLAFVALMPTLYAAFIWWGSRDTGFRRWQVAALPAVYDLFVAVLVFCVQPFGQARRADPAVSIRARVQFLDRLNRPGLVSARSPSSGLPIIIFPLPNSPRSAPAPHRVPVRHPVPDSAAWAA